MGVSYERGTPVVGVSYTRGTPVGAAGGHADTDAAEQPDTSVFFISCRIIVMVDKES